MVWLVEIGTYQSGRDPKTGCKPLKQIRLHAKARAKTRSLAVLGRVDQRGLKFGLLMFEMS
jgi:hypothetical protein